MYSSSQSKCFVRYRASLVGFFVVIFLLFSTPASAASSLSLFDFSFITRPLETLASIPHAIKNFLSLSLSHSFLSDNKNSNTAAAALALPTQNLEEELNRAKKDLEALKQLSDPDSEQGRELVNNVANILLPLTKTIREAIPEKTIRETSVRILPVNESTIAGLDRRITQLQESLASISSRVSNASSLAQSSVRMVALTQKIDNLDSVEVTNGLTVASGGLTISSGGLTLSSGSITVPSINATSLSITGSSVSHSVAATTTVPNNLIGAWNIATSTGAFPIFSIDSRNGRIGIGTSTPQFALDITGSSSAVWQSVHGTDDDLLGFWSFSEATGGLAYDGSKHGNDGTLTSGPTYVQGKYGTALSFDGSNDQVIVGDKDTLDVGSGNFSVEFWMNANSFIDSVGMVYKGARSAAVPGYMVRHVLNCQINFVISDGANRPGGCVNGLSAGEWYHVVAVADRANGVAYTYVNGVLREQLDISSVTGSLDTGDAFSIGKALSSSGGTSFYFNGMLDEVKVYKRALIVAEVKTHYLRNATTNFALSTATTTAFGDLYGLRSVAIHTGAATTGISNIYSIYSSTTRTGPTGGTINSYGGYFTVRGDTGGNSTTTAGYFSAAGADYNYGLLVEEGLVGIGTTTPAAKLSVAGGNIFFSGGQFIYASSSTSTIPNNAVNAWSIATSTGVTPVLSVDTTNGGRVGIGTTSPGTRLEVVETTAGTRGITSTQVNTGAQAAALSFNKARGTIAAPSVIANGDYLMSIAGAGYDGSGYVQAGAIQFLTNGAIAAGSIPTDLLFLTGSSGAGTERMRILSGGNVGIGTTSPNSVLNVAGATPKITLTNTSGGVNLKHWYLQSSSGDFIIATTSDALVDTATPAFTILDTSGNVGIGIATPTEPFHVVARSLITSGVARGGLFSLTAAPASNSSAQFLAANSSLALSGGSANFTSGATDANASFRAYATYDGSGTVSNLAGIVARVDNEGGGTVTNMYGFQVERFVNTSTITNTYGVYIGDITAGTQTNTPYSFYASDAGTYSYFAGNVGIGTTSPTQMLTVAAGVNFSGIANGAGTAYLCTTLTSGIISTSTSACNPSSLIYKENIENMTYGLEHIRSLRPVSYDYKPELLVKGRQIGFIAEEVYTLIPEVVGLKDGQPDNIDYAKMTAVLTKAVQELDQKLAEIASSSSTPRNDGDATNAWSIDQQSGRVNVSFFGDLNLTGNAIMNVTKIIGQNGRWRIDEDGTLTAASIKTQTLEIGSGPMPTAITIYDKQGKLGCLTIDNVDTGAVQIAAGACGATAPVAPPTPPLETASTTPLIDVLSAETASSTSSWQASSTPVAEATSTTLVDTPPVNTASTTTP